MGVPVDSLDRPIGSSGLPRAAVLRRVGRRLGIRTVRDLLFHLPRRYDDLRRISTIGELMAMPDGELVSARVDVSALRVEQSWRRRVQRTIAVLVDETGTAEATWFGRRFIERRLKEGDRIVVSGRLKHRGFLPVIDNPDFSPDQQADQALHAGRIVPIYPLTAGVTAQSLRLAMRGALDGPGMAYPEYLPPEVRDAERLTAIGRALEDVHFPSDFDALEAALRRLAFDELLAIQLGMIARRRTRTRESASRVAIADNDDERIRAGLASALASRTRRPVELTEDQRRAMADVRADLARGVPMLRLIQGDVGSGKTAVAAYALAAVADSGQGALLAPTDLLARQHAETVGALLEHFGIGVTLVTGSLPADARARANDLVRSGQARVVVGTHALFSESLSFADLSLVIVDEQHRFGVAQRAALEAKAGGRVPHVMLMTATPIPRTIGQVLYADLDVTDVRTLPSGRVPIRTAIRLPDDLANLWRFVCEEADRGHRTFVVVPLIGEDDADDAASQAGPDAAAAAEAEASRLAAVLSDPAALGAAGPSRGLRVGLVHGRLRPSDRDAEMTRFRDGELDVLVGTTVVEVGVDVPAATVMVIESAERFGLAQLHQLRGRVGRGEAASYCVLVSDSPEGSVGRARLEAVVAIRDGFELAERDLEIRREGDVLGFAQSGLPPLRVASLQRQEHRDLALATRRWADELVDADGAIGGPDALRHELAGGWLARLAAGDPGSGA